MPYFHVEPTPHSKHYRHGVVRISNLPHGISSHDIRKKFRNILWASIQRNSAHQSLGYAFVRFRTAGDAATIIRRYDGDIWLGRELRIYYNDDIPGPPRRPGYIHKRPHQW